MRPAIAFRKNWMTAVQKSGLSLSELGRASQNSPSKMHDIANGKYDETKDGPGLYGVHRTLAPLNTSLDTLIPPEKPARPGVNMFFSCFIGPRTHIERFSKLIDFCDVYKEPTGGLTHLERLGAKSLLARVSGLTDPTLLQLEFESWAAAKKAKIFNRQRKAWDDGHVMDSDLYDASFHRSSLRPHFNLLFAACRVVDFDAREKLIIYAEPLIYNP